MIKPSVLYLTLVLSPALTAAPLTAQSNGNGKSLSDGVYTVEQAERGGALNKEVCANCHADDWFTGNLLQSWSGASVEALFELIRTTMPQDRPGALKRQEYADLLAYIFSLNGIPAGEEELSGKKEVLAKIIINIQ